MPAFFGISWFFLNEWTSISEMESKEKEATKNIFIEAFRHNLRLKYAADRFFSWIFLMFFGPVIILIGFFIWIERFVSANSKGPVFYREVRISQGKPFRLYKFRVLNASALKKLERNGSVWFLQFDKKNTTMMGKILIQCYLDELPQLLNVFVGQMTLVGPRPRIPAIFEENVKGGFVALKYLKGGITGPAQLAKGVVKDGMPFSEVYLERCISCKPFGLLKYDLCIMIKSLFKIMKAEGL